MAKRQRMNWSMPTMPTSEQQRKMAAESMARTLVETDPAVEAKRAELTREILATTKRVMSGSKPFVKGRRR